MYGLYALLSAKDYNVLNVLTRFVYKMKPNLCVTDVVLKTLNDINEDMMSTF